MNKKLRLSVESKFIAGVCGGIGEYFSIDPTIIRLIWVAAAFLGAGAWVAIFAYIIFWAVIPSSR